MSGVMVLKVPANTLATEAKQNEIIEAIENSGGSGGYEVVGVKNASDTRINPATEEAITSLQTELQAKTEPQDIQNTEIINALRVLLAAVTNPAYVDKSANQMRVQATISSGTVTTVSTCSALTSFNSYNANQVVQQANVNAWANTCRARIS